MKRNINTAVDFNSNNKKSWFSFSCRYFQMVLFFLFTSACKKDKVDLNDEWNKENGIASVTGVTHATFKIRVVNRMEQLPPDVSNVGFEDALDDLFGAVTLTFADGTPVNSATTNIEVGAASGYVELPYGTYQFRVLTADGRQIPGDGVDDYKLFDPATSRIFGNTTTEPVTPLTFAPVQSFQPGGTYSITLRPNTFSFYVNAYPPVAEARQNQFLITADNESVNEKYSRVQVINAFTTAPVSFKINGQSINAVEFGKASAYEIVESGQSSIEALDAAGNILATTVVKVAAGQNISVWLWQSADGKAQALPVFNDLSAVHYNYNNPEYGVDNRVPVDLFPSAIRFLNLAEDEPYISFTADDGEHIGKVGLTAGRPEEKAFYNITPGSVLTTFPYVRLNAKANREFNLQAFRSQPGIQPGVWADEIPSLNSYGFVQNKLLYTNAGRTEPKFEPGFYTVALVKANNNATAAKKMIIVKHNK